MPIERNRPERNSASDALDSEFISSIWNGTKLGDFRSISRGDDNSAMKCLPCLQLFDSKNTISASDLAMSDGSSFKGTFSKLSKMDQGSLNAMFDRASEGKSGRSDELQSLDSGAVYMRSDMDIDADGSPRAKQIDPTGQTETSLTYKNGKAVNAEEIPYIVLPVGEHAKHGIKLGDVAAVRYNGKVAFAVFADRSVGKTGEGSMALAEALGINSNPRNGGVDQKNVEYLVFPGSGDHTPGNPHANSLKGAERLRRAALQA